jgi:hypothetical protein
MRWFFHGNSFSDPKDLLIPFIGKFDGSGVSGSTGRGRSQALESKVRFADHPGGDALQFLGSPVYLR